VKAAAVTPLTVIYQRQRSKYSPAEKAVVLSTKVFEPVLDGSRRLGGRPVSYRTSTARAADDRGWPCLVPISSHVTDAALLAAAAPALAAIEFGKLPDLPEGVQLLLLAPREITQTWAQLEEFRARVRRDQESREAARIAQEAPDAAARARLTAVVGEELLAPLNLRLTTSSGSWTALEAICEAYTNSTDEAARTPDAPSEGDANARVDA
jgi:hypothetical protein